MAVLSDIDERLQHPPFDRDAYENRLPEARAAAARMYLLHVSGDIADNEKWDLFLSILNEPPHHIPTSDHPVYCTDETRTAEDRLGYERCVYFYAGRAHPAFGRLALVFDSACEGGRDGSVTPFDSGGFVWQPTPHIQVRLAPRDDLPRRIEYCRQSYLTLDEWRDALARVLAAYFDELCDYWEGRPARADPESLYELNNDFRCWTFEIRLYDPQPIHDRVAWCGDETVTHELFRLHQAEPTWPGAPRPVARFVRDAIEPRGTPLFCRSAEGWVREQLGL